MRQFRLRSVLALIGVIAVSIWAGMWIERCRSRAVRTVMPMRSFPFWSLKVGMKVRFSDYAAPTVTLASGPRSPGRPVPSLAPDFWENVQILGEETPRTSRRPGRPDRPTIFPITVDPVGPRGD